MMDIEALLSPYGATAKSLGDTTSTTVNHEISDDGPTEDLGESLGTFVLEPAELPRPSAGKHRAEVPTDSVTPTAQVVPIQLGRLSA